MSKIVSITKLPKSEVEIKLEIESAEIEAKRPSVLKSLSQDIKMDGFRPGKVPEDVIVAKLGEATILEEALEEALRDIYPKVIEEKKIFTLGRPKIAVTSLEKGKNAEVIIKTDVYPEIDLADYKKIAPKIAKEKEEIEVTEKEVADAIDELKKYREKTEGADNKELTDEFVKKLGDFKDVADFTVKLKENLGKEKELKAKEAKRVKILDAIIKDSKLEIPEILVEEELDKMTNEFSSTLSRQGFTFEQYKKESGKTEEAVRNDWKEKAEKRVTGEILLIEIAKKENIKADHDEVHKEIDMLKKQYPEADEARLHAFIEDLLTKESVFKFLEKSE
jgi:FKBP-type peptidyl-prolyl cis-trans isomerase (trigger factor)